eukprot:TRINITY_DN18834_c0_g1_i1.p1 TRINITY_DN18834_c0_g1~~TRINITY_DN18834_c0_g1_i1.p1  ORF type:complete len:236 (+),score=33.16 TRINITY_DN18834_c0_g1_i1:65-772(+)
MCIRDRYKFFHKANIQEKNKDMEVGKEDANLQTNLKNLKFSTYLISTFFKILQLPFIIIITYLSGSDRTYSASIISESCVDNLTMTIMSRYYDFYSSVRITSLYLIVMWITMLCVESSYLYVRHQSETKKRPVAVRQNKVAVDPYEEEHMVVKQVSIDDPPAKPSKEDTTNFLNTKIEEERPKSSSVHTKTLNPEIHVIQAPVRPPSVSKSERKEVIVDDLDKRVIPEGDDKKDQ